MIDKKRLSLRFKGICGPKANNSGKCLILLEIVLFIEEWLRLLPLSKAGLSRQFCPENFLQIRKNTFQ